MIVMDVLVMLASKIIGLSLLYVSWMPKESLYVQQNLMDLDVLLTHRHRI